MDLKTKFEGEEKPATKRKPAAKIEKRAQGI